MFYLFIFFFPFLSELTNNYTTLITSDPPQSFESADVWEDISRLGIGGGGGGGFNSEYCYLCLFYFCFLNRGGARTGYF